MPIFTNAPPDEPSGRSLRLRRTPSAGKLTAIITCRQLVGCPTHFFQRRTVPCDGEGCEACRTGHSWRWHGYVTAVDCKTNEHFIFEMTAQAAEALTVYRERHGTLLGCLFEAARLGEHHNGRVMIRCKPTDLTSVKLPSAPDVIASLCHIWNVPTPEASIEGQLKQHDRIVIKRNPDGNNKPVPQTVPQT